MPDFLTFQEEPQIKTFSENSIAEKPYRTLLCGLCSRPTLMGRERGHMRALPKGLELRVEPDANLGLQDLRSAVLSLHSFSLSLAEAKNLG